MSSKSSLKKPPLGKSTTQQDDKKNATQQDEKKEPLVKLRRKESNNKNSQNENQRKSVFRFLHRDKKKNPELPEHGFIPDGRRILDGPSRSLTLTPGFSPDHRNRWSSYEPVDFSKLSTTSSSSKPDDPPTNKDWTSLPTEETSTNKRSLSHESVSTAPDGRETSSSSPRQDNFKDLPKEGIPTTEKHLVGADAALEKMKRIDEKLDGVLKERRSILEKLLFKTPIKSVPTDHPQQLNSLLFDSFIFSENLTKFASRCMNSPENNVTSDDVMVIKPKILELQRNLSLILEMVCSNLKDKSDLQSSSSSSPSSLPKDSENERYNQTTHSLNEVSSIGDASSTNVYPSLESSVGELSLSSPAESISDEVQEIPLSKIDEENEDVSTIDRNSQPSEPPIVPMDTHPLNQDLRFSVGSEHLVTFHENELNLPQNDISKLSFLKEKSSIRKSSSASCFPESRIHSSIAEEDEEAFCEDDDNLNNDDSFTSGQVCLRPPEPVEMFSNVAKETCPHEEVDEKMGLNPVGFETAAIVVKEVTSVVECDVNEKQFTTTSNDNADGCEDVLNNSPQQFTTTSNDNADGGEDVLHENLQCASMNDDNDSEPDDDIILLSSYVGKLDCDVDLGGDDNDIIKTSGEECVVANVGGLNEEQPINVEMVTINTNVEPVTHIVEIEIPTYDSTDLDLICDNIEVKEINNINHQEITMKSGALSCEDNNGCDDDAINCLQKSNGDDDDHTHKVEKHYINEGDHETVEFVNLEEATGNDLVYEESVSIVKIHIIEVDSIDEEGGGDTLKKVEKIENVEILFCEDERLDNMGGLGDDNDDASCVRMDSVGSLVDDNDDTSGVSTPGNSDTSDPLLEANHVESNRNDDEAGLKASLVQPSNKTGNNKNKRKNKKRKKNQQQTTTGHDKDSKNLNLCMTGSNSEAIVTTSRS